MLPLLLPVLLAGCGGTEVPEDLAPVAGTVQVDGETVPGIAVNFIPVDESTAGTGGYGATDEAGKYTLLHRSGEPGIESGEYKVVLSRMVTPDGNLVPPDQSAADVGAEEWLPPMYSSYDETTLTATVPAEGNPKLDFDVTRK